MTLFTTNTPWLRTVRQFDDEAIASTAVRLAPMGRIDAETLLRLHLEIPHQSVASIAAHPHAIAELAALGSFDVEKLSLGAFKIFKDRVVFLGKELPVGWFAPERRRVAPARLAADRENARIRNMWLLSAIPCDIDTGEALVDRCPSCLALLNWTKLPNVWSCTACEFDLRTATPRRCPPETVAAARTLANYVLGNDTALPAPLGDLPFLDILKIAGWLGYFRALPGDLHLGIGAKNAASGFAELKRWPYSFDEIVRRALAASTETDLASGDIIGRHTTAARFMASVDRLPSKMARILVRSRLMSLFGLHSEFREIFASVTEPVLQLGLAATPLPRRR